MQAVKEMQVMGLTLNRCDSMLERQSCLMLVENTTREREQEQERDAFWLLTMTVQKRSFSIQ